MTDERKSGYDAKAWSERKVQLHPNGQSHRFATPTKRQRRPLTVKEASVLRALLYRGAAAPGSVGWWQPHTTEQVRGVIDRLGMRGLVDVSGWDYANRRTYAITPVGRVVLARNGGNV